MKPEAPSTRQPDFSSKPIMLMKQHSLEMNEQEQKQNARHIANKINSKPFDLTKPKTKRVAPGPIKPIEGIDTSNADLSIMGNNPRLGRNKTRILEEEKQETEEGYSSGSSKAP